ncbi:hypothetical protein ACFX13_011235 [Malus domestica]|uniref:uncharacterized protein n=1 Tax=Malus domestica TaxID=3750 RepID=UPI0010AAB769|nr:uncharacterized protein LOC103451619 [Malus domestica]
MEDFSEELEPLFDYRRVQPVNLIFLDDDELDAPSASPPKRREISDSAVEKVDEPVKVVSVISCEDKEEEDWLPPPPKVSAGTKRKGEDSTIKELRKKKKELASYAQSAENVLRSVEESVIKELSILSEAVEEQPPKPRPERNKIVVSIQDKDGVKQFRIYADDKFERLFKMYADNVKLDLQSLVFCFDGDKIGPAATPDALGMEENDIIEVHVTSR